MHALLLNAAAQVKRHGEEQNEKFEGARFNRIKQVGLDPEIEVARISMH